LVSNGDRYFNASVDAALRVRRLVAYVDFGVGVGAGAGRLSTSAYSFVSRAGASYSLPETMLAIVRTNEASTEYPDALVVAVALK
jgi:hypothetical protein